MPYLDATVTVIARLHAGAASKSVSIKQKNTTDRGVTALDHVVATLATLPGTVAVFYANAANGPTEIECRRAIQPVVQSLGGPPYQFDLVTPPERSGHYFNGSVWQVGNGHAYVVQENGDDVALPFNLDAVAGGGGEPVILDYLVAVSWA